MTNTNIDHAAEPEDVDAVEGDDILGSAAGGAGDDGWKTLSVGGNGGNGG